MFEIGSNYVTLFDRRLPRECRSASLLGFGTIRSALCMHVHNMIIVYSVLHHKPHHVQVSVYFMSMAVFLPVCSNCPSVTCSHSYFIDHVTNSHN